jgi:hypothetical protein
LEEEKEVARRLAKKEKDLTEELKAVKSKSGSSPNGGDSKSLEMQTLLETVYAVGSIDTAFPKMVPRVQKLAEFILKKDYLGGDDYGFLKMVLTALHHQAALTRNAEQLVGWLLQVTQLRDIFIEEYAEGDATSDTEGFAALHHSAVDDEDNDSSDEDDSEESSESDDEKPKKGSSAKNATARKFLADLLSTQLAIVEDLLDLIKGKLSPVLKAAILEHKKPELKKTTTVLSNLQKAFKKYNATALMTEQLFTQVLHFVDCFLLNAMLEDGNSFCTAGNAFNVKMSLSFVEQWAVTAFGNVVFERMKDASMKFVTEATTLLVMDKSAAIVNDLRQEIWPSLNPTQVSALFKNYKPDQISPSPVGDDVKKLLKEASKRNEVLKMDESAIIYVSGRK